MTFAEIFKQEGLYRCASFADGFAFRIKKNQFDSKLELDSVQYSSPSDLLPKDYSVRVYDRLFDMEFEKVLTIRKLFK